MREEGELAVKIVDVSVAVLRVPVDRRYTAGGRAVDANWHVLARVTTSDGVQGAVPEIQAHLLAAVANGLVVEYVPRSAGILQAMPRIEDGELIVSQAPGLGLLLDEDAVARYTAARDTIG